MLIKKLILILVQLILIYIEIDDAQQVNDDFIQLNLSKNEYSSEEI